MLQSNNVGVAAFLFSLTLKDERKIVSISCKFCMVKHGTSMHILLCFNAEPQKYLTTTVLLTLLSKSEVPSSGYVQVLPRLSLACSDQTISPSTPISTQLSLIMQGRKAAAWSSLFSPPPQISVGSNSGSLWRVIGERAHWFAVGLGESHVWAQEAERESKRSGRHVCMCVCVSFGGTLGSAAVLTNPSKTSTHFLCRHSRCLADLAPLSSFVCVFCSQSKQVMAS